jgi:hypothetical protein
VLALVLFDALAIGYATIYANFTLPILCALLFVVAFVARRYASVAVAS